MVSRTRKLVSPTCPVEHLQCDVDAPAQWQWVCHVDCHLVCHMESCWREDVTVSRRGPSPPLHVQEVRLWVMEVDPVTGQSGPVCGQTNVSEVNSDHNMHEHYRETLTTLYNSTKCYKVETYPN